MPESATLILRLSGQAGILLEGAHFSRVSSIPVPAAPSGARHKRLPERRDSADDKTSQSSVQLEENMALSHVHQENT